MISNQDPEYREWIGHRSGINAGNDAVHRIMNRIAAWEAERPVSQSEWSGWISGLDIGIVRFGLAFSLLAIGMFRLAYISGIIIP
jgi:hypothetical protein